MESKIVVTVLALLVLTGACCSVLPLSTLWIDPSPEESRDPLYWVSYKEITGRNLVGDLVTIKLPSGYRVCHCESKIDSVEFECGDCDLYR